MKTSWGWRRARRGRTGWSAPSPGAFSVAVPWITLLLLIVLLRNISGALTSAEGILFDLPDAGLAEGETTDLVALALTMPTGTLVFFDDARYMIDDDASALSLGEHVGERVREAGQKTLLVLADRTVPTGDLMKIAARVREGGVGRVLFANKKTEGPAE